MTRQHETTHQKTFPNSQNLVTISSDVAGWGQPVMWFIQPITCVLNSILIRLVIANIELPLTQQLLGEIQNNTQYKDEQKYVYLWRSCCLSIDVCSWDFCNIVLLSYTTPSRIAYEAMKPETLLRPCMYNQHIYSMPNPFIRQGFITRMLYS